jgi:hypothetical protein
MKKLLDIKAENESRAQADAERSAVQDDVVDATFTEKKAD